jgi:hypothetical protein
MLRRYMSFHLSGLRVLSHKLIGRADRRLFALLFNMASFLGRSPARVRWSQVKENFLVTDLSVPGFSYEIRHQRQCLLAYQSGARKRAATLADDYFLGLIEWVNGDVVLDCGANVGDLKIWFELEGVDVDYVGFEPSPIEFSCLESNVSPSQVHPIGLWNTQGNLEFYISSQGADSSLIEPGSYESKVHVKVDRLEKYVSGPVKLL